MEKIYLEIYVAQLVCFNLKCVSLYVADKAWSKTNPVSCQCVKQKKNTILISVMIFKWRYTLSKFYCELQPLSLESSDSSAI